MCGAFSLPLTCVDESAIADERRRSIFDEGIDDRKDDGVGALEGAADHALRERENGALWSLDDDDTDSDMVLIVLIDEVRARDEERLLSAATAAAPVALLIDDFRPPLPPPLPPLPSVYDMPSDIVPTDDLRLLPCERGRRGGKLVATPLMLVCECE